METPSMSRSIDDGEPNAGTIALENIPGVRLDPGQQSLSVEDVPGMNAMHNVAANAHEGIKQDIPFCTTTYNTAIHNTRPPPP